MKSAIIIGASSGIGRALAVALSLDGYRVGVVARRTDLLTQLQAELTGPCAIRTVDVSQPELAMPLVRDLIEELRDVEGCAQRQPGRARVQCVQGVRVELP
jgi:NADP-dependent 3-hydroxy acid dehydrogenase YdfG